MQKSDNAIETVTARQIIRLVMDQLPYNTSEDWEEILSNINADLLLIHRIGLDTPLEAHDDPREV